MNHNDLLALYDQDQRIAVEYPDSIRQAFPDLVRATNKSAHRNGAVIYSRLTAANVDQVIDEQISFFESIGQDFEWKAYAHDTPPDLVDRLAARGFEIEEAEAIMVLDAHEAPAKLLEPVMHDIRRIHDPAELAAVRAVEEAVWDEDKSGLIHYLAGALSEQPQQMSVFVACIDDAPAAAAWIYYPPNSQFASLWGGSTLAEQRRRGLYTALLARRLQEALRGGVSYLTVDASPMSRPILEKFGFVLISHAYACNWQVNKEQNHGS